MSPEPTALDVAKEIGALAGKTLIYTAALGGFLIFTYWFTAGVHELVRIMK